MIPTAQQPHADSSFSDSASPAATSHSPIKLSCQVSQKVFFRVLPRSGGGQEQKKKVQLHLNIQNKAIAMHQAVTTVTVGSKPRTLHGD